MPETTTAAKKKIVSSAEKHARASERKRDHNKKMKSRIRTGLSRLGELLKGDPQQAGLHARQVVSLLDRAAKSHVMHRNAARRYKARVMMKLQSLKK